MVKSSIADTPLINIKCSDEGPLSQELIKVLEKHRWDREHTEWSQ